MDGRADSTCFGVDHQTEHQADLVELKALNGPSTAMYKSLPTTTSCRLLRILPGKAKDPLRCSLKIIDLRDPHPAYEAVSYVWGSQKKPNNIECDGVQLAVTQSLDDGLRRIRYRDRVRVVWVDAVSINQDEHAERTNQVKLMGRIYKQAERVLVWLGRSGSSYAKQAFSSLQTIHETYWTAQGNDGSKIPDASSTEKIDWEALRRLYQLEYFRRVWVLQEIAGASDAQLLWGNQSLPWKLAGRATYFLANNKRSSLRLVDDDSFGLLNAYLMYRIPHAEFQPVRFFDLLRITNRFLASDDRDKVFAVLGLPNQDCDQEHGVFFVEPDYTLSRDEVYRQVATRAFDTSPMKLDLLAAVEHENGIRKEAPSWIPQWHISNTVDLVSHRPEARYAPAGGPSECMAWANSPRIVENHIVAYGFEHDTILDSTEVLASRGVDNSWYHDTIKAWLNRVSASIGKKLSHEEVAWTLLTGKDWYGVPMSSLQGIRGEEDLGDEALASAWTYCRNRKLFLTKNGSLGLGPAALEIGDRVCVLLTATVPFVLRPYDGFYRLAGACYVRYIMAGELPNEWKDGKRSMGDLQIR
ncbi:heterokaryon incompatibility protein-domain-containing protein [Lophiotrema nucula]|uniref:Heterokaryon incompatibility protein-domain-containing protein n=1 Tax=Lophiotrema nucula TaxID=690887 RepID=A0A6A5ZQG9_9PLEO|nr:heterokaryon incompatibility protein-domain-containing protein [Lophiotrema nucula]